jgi:hypothetical protein
MRIYFSGGRGLTTTPEALIAHRKPHVMLTYHGMDQNCIIDRFNVYVRRMGFPEVPPAQVTRKVEKVDHPLYIESMFMDSGAFTFYNDHVMRKKTNQRFVHLKQLRSDLKEVSSEFMRGYQRLAPSTLDGFLTDVDAKEARYADELKASAVLAGRQSVGNFRPREYHDYSFYDLKKGSEFRNYCARYAKLMQKYAPAGCLFTTVDAIRNPERTWDIQMMFENEWGLTPVPVIHAGQNMKYLDRYLERGGYSLIGFGGLGQNMNVDEYSQWADKAFHRICPASNGYKPIVRVHGFAMTSWRLICRWPWWSVDSATWVKLGAYGWVYVPRMREDGTWRFDCPPHQLGVSNKSAFRGTSKHIDHNPKGLYIVREWLKKYKIDEEQARNLWEIRGQAVLHYLKDLEETRPKWPYPLDLKSVEDSVAHSKGFGLK